MQPIETLPGDLLGWAKQNPPHWANETLAVWDKEKQQAMEPFLTSKFWGSAQSMNVFRVIGTDHPDYQGKSWLWLLENGKRMVGNQRELQRNPGYYLEVTKKQPEMSYISLDGQRWFVYCDGNHRTCLARFAHEFWGRNEIHGVELFDYRHDLELANLYEQLLDVNEERQLQLRLTTAQRTVRRDDNPGWMQEYYEPRVVVRPVQREAIILDRQGLADFLFQLKQPRHRRWWQVLFRSLK